MKRLLGPFVCLFAILFFFREFPASHFNHTSGDLGDGRLALSIFEYWRLFFTGHAAFASPSFFYPKQGVLGYSDCDFLLALPYCGFRLFISDIYLAYEWTAIFIQCLGFTAFYVLLRRWLNLGTYVAAFGALLFSISNLYYVSAYHFQLRAVNFIPLILLLFAVSADLQLLHPRKAVLASSAGAALTALLFLTSFYIAWFFLLAALLAGILYLLAVVFVSGFREVAKFRSQTALLAIPIFTFIVFMVPFFVTYLPTLRETGDRPYQLALLFCSIPQDFINVGSTNVLWGWTARNVLAGLGTRPNYWEFERGWPIIMAAIFLLTGTAALVRILRARGCGVSRRVRIAGMIFIVVLGCWFLQLKWRGLSAWWLVYYLVPGAKAIRVPVRFNFVLNIGVVLVCATGLQYLFDICSRSKRQTVLALAGAGLLCAGMVFEQANTAQSHLVDRTTEMRRLEGVPPPPTMCREFYVTPAQGRISTWDNIDAMLLAEEIHLPTINGYSGWFPHGWDLLTEAPSYPGAVKHWALINGPLTGLCAVDLALKQWRPPDALSTDYYQIGEKIDFRQGGNSNQYVMDGWGDEEPGGRWTLGGRAQVQLPIAAPVGGPLQLIVECEGFNPGRAPSSTVSLEVNGQQVFHDVTPMYEPATLKAHLDGNVLHTGNNMVTFLFTNPKRPSDFGSPDTRILGLSVQDIVVNEAASYHLGEKIDFRKGGNSSDYAVDGWGDEEPGGRWTIGTRARMVVFMATKSDGPVELEVECEGFNPGRSSTSTVSIEVNGAQVFHGITPRDEPTQLKAHFAGNSLHAGNNTIQFLLTNPRRPSDFGSHDTRILGVSVKSVTIEPTK